MAETIAEKIKRIEDEIRNTQFNKATEHHISLLKAKIARFKRLAIARAAKSVGGGKGFSVRKEGDATVVMAGFPSVGKSTILNKLTSAKSEIAEYEFTTLETIPGMLHHGGAAIQLLDIPGLISGAAEGRGRGREVISVVRASDLILIICDAQNIEKIQVILDELEKASIRVDKRPPLIKVEKKVSGGITIHARRGTSAETIREFEDICKEFGLLSADIIMGEHVTPDQLIDHLSGSCVYIPSITVVNKIDKRSKKELEETEKKLKHFGRDYVFISAEDGTNINGLKDRIFKKLNLIRVYTKRKEGKEFGEPMIIRNGSVIADVCVKIHKDLKKNFKYALVTGSSVKFQSQRVGLDHKVAEGDRIVIITEH
jgi:hypothetical protein